MKTLSTAIFAFLLGSQALALTSSWGYTAGTVIGNIDGILPTGIFGWACVVGDPNPITVNIYAGTSPNGEVIAQQLLSNNASEPGVAAACATTSQNYRFFIAPTAQQLALLPGQKIYVTGNAPAGGVSGLVQNSGVSFPVAGQPLVSTWGAAPGSIIGNIDGITASAISGWACLVGNASPISVNLYAGAAYPSGEVVAQQVFANRSSEVEVASACASTGQAYRFSIPLTPQQLVQLVGKSIYVSGFSAGAATGVSINNSGAYHFPNPAESLLAKPANVKLVNAMAGPYVCPYSLCTAVGASPQAMSFSSSLYTHTQTNAGPTQSEFMAVDDLSIGTGSGAGQMVAKYIGMQQLFADPANGIAGAGSAWALRVQNVRGVPGVPNQVGATNPLVGYELGYVNNDVDLGPGSAFAVGIYAAGGSGSYTNMAGFYLDDASAQGVRGWHDGVVIANSTVAQDNSILDSGWGCNTSVDISGTHKVGLTTASSSIQQAAINMNEGQQVCLGATMSGKSFVGNSCLKMLSSGTEKGRLVYQVGGQSVFSIGAGGTARMIGSIIAHDPAP